MLKGKNTLRLVVVLGVLVGVYAVIKLTSGGGRSKSYREVLVEIDTAKVTQVEITSGQGTTKLEKKDGLWFVGENKKAMASSVKGMLTSLNTIEPSRLASRSQDSWKDLQVDSSGVRVQVYEGADEALDLIIGRFGVEGQRSYYSYVRLADDDDTYVANNFMSMSIGKTAADYRNSRILRLKKDSINSIDFNYPEGTYTLEKSGNSWMMAGVATDSANVARYLNGLGNVNSKKFEDGEIGQSEKNVIIHLSGNDDVTIDGFGGNILGSSQNEGEYFKDQASYNKVFKEPTYFSGND